MKRTLSSIALGLALAAFALDSAAAVVDFEVLYHNDTNVSDAGYLFTEDGFQLENTGAFPFASYGAQDPDFTGSTALFNDNDGGVTTLRRVGGEVFNLVSIDLAEQILGLGTNYSVEFIGTTLAQGTVTQTFVLDGLAGAQTFAFDSGFRGLLSVSWANTADYHQFDNIVVVPAPATLTMALFGLGMLGTALRRRREVD